MKRPPVGLLASCGALLLSLVSFAAAQDGAAPLNWQQGRAPQKTTSPAAPKSSNAPGTAAPVYNQQRNGSVDPAAVAARNSPTPAAPQQASAKPGAVKQATYVNEPRLLDQARRDERVSPVQYPEYVDDPTMYNEGPGDCATCGAGGCATGNCPTANCGGGLSDCVPCNYFALSGWYLGGDYVNARVNYSDPAAIVVRDVIGGGFDFNDRIVPYETSYQSTFRVNAGYRWGACGESINFSYFNFNDNTTVNSPEVNANVVVAGPFALNCNPGEHLRTGLEVAANVYDLDYSKRIPICTSNCDPCGGGCPPWAITWSAGARVGTLDLNSPTQLFDVNNVLAVDALSEVTFTGAGPRIAFEGRRYFGDCARWSAYGKSSLALLLGQYDVEQRVNDIRGNARARQEHHYTRIVPVIDLEVGLSRQLGKKTLLTAGYFMQVWIDASTVNNLNQPGVAGLNPANVDDANMTMFDGFMIRLERVF